MRSKVFVGFMALVGFLLVTNPMGADAAIPATGENIENSIVTDAGSATKAKPEVFKLARCDVEAITPRAFPMDTEAYIEGWLTCDAAILPEIFNNTVCLQVRKGNSFVDNGCCKIPKTTVSTTPWVMCGEPWALLPGTHEYRTKARAFRPSTGKGETDYSPVITFTL